MQNTPDLDPRVIDALWRVVAEHGWHGVTFRRIADESGESLESLRGLGASPFALLAAHARAVDRAVLAGTVPNGGGTVRDRIFDVLMRRFDALAPHREGLLRFQADLRRDPLLALALSPGLMASMAWMLEAAEVDTAGFTGGLRVQGLVGVWLSVSRAWVNDDSADLGPTMSALDKALDQAERVARTLRLPDGDLAAPPPAEDADLPAAGEMEPPSPPEAPNPYTSIGPATP
ncbi:TetR family transcriptional regulator [Roseomonas sp. BN140053]|uniref:TetR family transcriptional regulator n=1 Tax=Roseomonas sp. BN140053 TaxID=3391898 RepID=UPI0039EC8250